MNNMPSSMKKSIKPESCQMAKMFSFSSSSFSWLFHNGFHTKRQHFTLSIAPAHCFFTSLKSHEALLNWSLKNYGFIEVPFSSYMHKLLSNEMYLFRKIAELEICNSWCAWRVWTMILQPILHTSAGEACEDRLAALW